MGAEFIELGGFRSYFGAGGTLEGGLSFELNKKRCRRKMAAEATREVVKLRGDIVLPCASPGASICGCRRPPFGWSVCPSQHFS